MRRWLENHKIYFDTLAAVLLSAMAVVVAVAQLSVARTQTEIRAEQRDLLQLQQSPLLEIRSYFIENSATGKVDEHVIEVINNGGLARAVSANAATFIDSELHFRDSSEAVRARLPLLGYFFAYFPRPAGADTLYEIRGDKNNKKWASIERALYSWMEEDEEVSSCQIRLVTYVRVSFDTIHDESRTEYYRIRAGGGRKVEEEFAESLFEEFRRSALDMDATTPEELGRQLKELGQDA